MFQIMSMTLRNINPQKEIFHHYDFPVYTTSKYRDPKLDTYRRITLRPLSKVQGGRNHYTRPYWFGKSRKLFPLGRHRAFITQIKHI